MYMKSLSSKTYWFLMLACVAGAFLVSVALYQEVPDSMVSHWGIDGNPDGHMPKFWGLFLMPMVSLGILGLFWIIPKIDPLKHNIASFRSYYDEFVLLIIVFLLYIHIVSILWNTGYHFDMGMAITPAIGILFVYIGRLLKHTKRNWFMGIRTPWTLSSDSVWEKTHKLGSVLFQITGVSMFVGLLFPKILFGIVLVGAIGSALITVVYSYIVFKEEEKH